MYLQTFLGARFMLPLKYRKKKGLFKTKNELLAEKADSKGEECAICLIPIINDKKETKEEMNDSSKDKYENNVEIIINKHQIYTDKSLNKNRNGNNKQAIDNKKSNKKYDRIKKIKENFVVFMRKLKSLFSDGFFNFYKDKKIKDFILLPCGHFFHALCFKEWFKVTKECCICRAPMNNLNIQY